MPTFDFECPSCKQVIELHFVQTDFVPTCESCDVPMVRMISVSSVILKGDGWATKEGKR